MSLVLGIYCTAVIGWYCLTAGMLKLVTLRGSAQALRVAFSVLSPRSAVYVAGGLAVAQIGVGTTAVVGPAHLGLGADVVCSGALLIAVITRFKGNEQACVCFGTFGNCESGPLQIFCDLAIALLGVLGIHGGLRKWNGDGPLLVDRLAYGGLALVMTAVVGLLRQGVVFGVPEERREL